MLKLRLDRTMLIGLNRRDIEWFTDGTERPLILSAGDMKFPGLGEIWIVSGATDRELIATLCTSKLGATATVQSVVARARYDAEGNIADADMVAESGFDRRR